MNQEENEESNRDSSVDESRGSVEQSIDFDPEVDSGSETKSFLMLTMQCPWMGLVYVH